MREIEAIQSARVRKIRVHPRSIRTFCPALPRRKMHGNMQVLQMPDSIEIIEIIVNGDKHAVPRGITVAELLKGLGMAVRGVAVEVNYEVVPGPRHAEHQLAPGDSLEVVSLVGGG